MASFSSTDREVVGPSLGRSLALDAALVHVHDLSPRTRLDPFDEEDPFIDDSASASASDVASIVYSDSGDDVDGDQDVSEEEEEDEVLGRSFERVKKYHSWNKYKLRRAYSDSEDAGSVAHRDRGARASGLRFAESLEVRVTDSASEVESEVEEESPLKRAQVTRLELDTPSPRVRPKINRSSTTVADLNTLGQALRLTSPAPPVRARPSRVAAVKASGRRNPVFLDSRPSTPSESSDDDYSEDDMPVLASIVGILTPEKGPSPRVSIDSDRPAQSQPQPYLRPEGSDTSLPLPLEQQRGLVPSTPKMDRSNASTPTSRSGAGTPVLPLACASYGFEAHSPSQT